MTDTEQRHLKIIRTLCPDWGRTTRDCEACGGSGVMSSQDFGEADDYPICTNSQCPDCNGHGVVFREWLPCECCRVTTDIDSMTRATCGKCNYGRVPDVEGWTVIAKAATVWACQRRQLAYSDWLRKIAMKGMTESESGIWVWDNRHREEYQRQLEAHVRNYTPPVPDLLTAMNPDDATELWLKRLLREAGHGYLVSCNIDASTSIYVQADVRNGDHFAASKANTEPEALLAAVEAAVLEED